MKKLLIKIIRQIPNLIEYQDNPNNRTNHNIRRKSIVLTHQAAWLFRKIRSIWFHLRKLPVRYNNYGKTSYLFKKLETRQNIRFTSAGNIDMNTILNYGEPNI